MNFIHRAIASNSIPKRMKTMIPGDRNTFFWRVSHGGTEDTELGNLNAGAFAWGILREVWRGCLSRSYIASSRGFGRQVEDAAINDRFRCVLAPKSIICLGARFFSIGGRSVSPPSVKQLDGIMAICLKFLVDFRCDCPERRIKRRYEVFDFNSFRQTPFVIPIWCRKPYY